MRCPKRLERRRDARGLATEPLERRQCLAAAVSVTLAEPIVIEGETHVATVRLSQALAQVERVLVSTADRTASFGRDYFRMMSEQLVFMPGETMKTVSIKTLRDSATEGVETLEIIATPINAALRSGATLAAIGDYTPPPFVNVASVAVTEGSSGTTPASFTVTLSAAFPKPVSVSYATRDGSATVVDLDYQSTSGRLTFAPGETSKTVTVNVVGDRKVEANENFSLVVSAPTNAVLRQASATCTIRNDEIDQSGYQITLNFLTSAAGDVPQSVRAIAAEAAAKWSRVIVGDLPSVTDANGFVDDIVFNVQMGLLGGAQSGPGGVLANAAPVNFRQGGNGLPYEAVTGIDPADAATQTANDRAYLLDILVHEMGHGLGFTDGATVFGRFVNAASSSFTGPNALREFNSTFGATATGVPLQPVVLAHWDETVFGNELMTPFISAPGNAISRVTVGALQDMGYTVNYAGAETYRPGGSPVTAPATGRPPASLLPPPSQTLAARPPATQTPPASKPSLIRSSFAALEYLPITSVAAQPDVARNHAPAIAMAALSMPQEFAWPRKGVGAKAFAGIAAR